MYMPHRIPKSTAHNAAFRTQIHNEGSQRIVANCYTPPKRTRNVDSQRATRKRGRDNAGCHNAARIVATQPPQRNPQRRNHARRCSATACGNAEPQRHGANAGLQHRGLRAGCNNAELLQRAMWVATTRL